MNHASASVCGEACGATATGGRTTRSAQHALKLIEQIAQESTCPVIALRSAENPAYVREAAKRGVFAYLVDNTPDELQSAIDVTLQRFSEYQDLQGRSGAGR